MRCAKKRSYYLSAIGLKIANIDIRVTKQDNIVIVMLNPILALLLVQDNSMKRSAIKVAILIIKTHSSGKRVSTEGIWAKKSSLM